MTKCTFKSAMHYVAVALAMLAPVEAMVPCMYRSCAALYEASPSVENELNCGDSAIIISELTVTVQDNVNLQCNNDSTVTDPLSITNFTSDCDFALLAEQLKSDCEGKQKCSFDLSKIPLDRGCPNPALIKAVTVEVKCVKKPDVLVPLVLLVTVLIAFGMGNSVDPPAWKETLKKEWKGVLIGMLCQYGLMPALAFGISKIFLRDLHILVSVGLVLTGSVPGGSLSNLMTKMAKGNVALSIIMSAVSSFTAFGFLPLLILIYVNQGLGLSLDELPWDSLGFSLAAIIGAPIAGFIFRRFIGDKKIKKTYKGEQIAYHQIVTTAALVLGFIFCLIVIAIGIKDNPQYFTRIQESSEAWIIGVVFQPIAFILGYLLAWIFRFKRAECRAISIETGMQNTTVAIAICSIAYSGCDRYHSLYLVWMVSLWMMINGLIISFLFRGIARYDPPQQVQPINSNSVADGTDLEALNKQSEKN